MCCDLCYMDNNYDGSLVNLATIDYLFWGIKRLYQEKDSSIGGDERNISEYERRRHTFRFFKWKVEIFNYNSMK